MEAEKGRREKKKRENFKKKDKITNSALIFFRILLLCSFLVLVGESEEEEEDEKGGEKLDFCPALSKGDVNKQYHAFASSFLFKIKKKCLDDFVFVFVAPSFGEIVISRR